jgi:hypothetical protein
MLRKITDTLRTLRIFCLAYLDDNKCYRQGEGRDSSVAIETRYGLGGPRIETRWGEDFLHPSRPAVRPTQPSIQWVPVHTRG